ncbi:hypothetical protein THAOC_10616, partial [Thalassiosira oceanica]
GRSGRRPKHSERRELAALEDYLNGDSSGTDGERDEDEGGEGGKSGGRPPPPQGSRDSSGGDDGGTIDEDETDTEARRPNGPQQPRGGQPRGEKDFRRGDRVEVRSKVRDMFGNERRELGAGIEGLRVCVKKQMGKGSHGIATQTQQAPRQDKEGRRREDQGEARRGTGRRRQVPPPVRERHSPPRRRRRRRRRRGHRRLVSQRPGRGDARRRRGRLRPRRGEAPRPRRGTRRGGSRFDLLHYAPGRAVPPHVVRRGTAARGRHPPVGRAGRRGREVGGLEGLDVGGRQARHAEDGRGRQGGGGGAKIGRRHGDLVGQDDVQGGLRGRRGG